MARERPPAAADLARHLLDAGSGHAGLRLGEVRRVGSVDLLERPLELLEIHGSAGPFLDEVLLPVDPAAHELTVPGAVAEQDVDEGQEQRGFRARPRREPVVGHGGRIAQPRVHHAHLGPGHLALDDPLRVRVEVVPRLQVRRQQQDEARVAMIRRGPVEAVPEGIAGPRGGGADIGVAVVSVDAPGVEDALQIDELVPGPAQVVHDLLLPALDERLADAPADIVQDLAPGHALPLSCPALPGPLERVENALRILDLIEGGGSLGAIAPAAAGMLGVALELLDLERLLVHIGQEAAGCLAVEADGGDERIAARDPLGPGLGVVLLPVIPAHDGRIAVEPRGRRVEVAGVRVKRLGRRVRHWGLTKGGLTRAAAPGRRVPRDLPRARARPARARRRSPRSPATRDSRAVPTAALSRRAPPRSRTAVAADRESGFSPRAPSP